MKIGIAMGHVVMFVGSQFHSIVLGSIALTQLA